MGEAGIARILIFLNLGDGLWKHGLTGIWYVSWKMKSIALPINYI